jgi:hypothetical protein
MAGFDSAMAAQKRGARARPGLVVVTARPAALWFDLKQRHGASEFLGL